MVRADVGLDVRNDLAAKELHVHLVVLDAHERNGGVGVDLPDLLALRAGRD